jgi:hypothetical protein
MRFRSVALAVPFLGWACSDPAPPPPVGATDAAQRDVTAAGETGRDLGEVGATLDSAGSPPDASSGDDLAKTADAAGATDATDAESPRPTAFPARLAGAVWLVGWAGALEHWSWMRFHPAPGGASGTWEVAPLRCQAKSCVGFMKGPMNFDGCSSSSGTFVTDGPATLRLTIPPECRALGTPVNGMEAWEFHMFHTRTPGYRPQSLESVSIDSSRFNSFTGHRYRADLCPGDLSTCPVVPFATAI